MKRLLSAVLSVLMVLSAIAMPALASPDASPFSDVPPTHWAAASIAYCYDNGFINGTGNGKFSPDKALSYAEFVTMVARSIDYRGEIAQVYEKELPAGSPWWQAPINWAYCNGLLDNMAIWQPIPDRLTTSGPAYLSIEWKESRMNATIDRYEMALFVRNALNENKADPNYMNLAKFDYFYPDASAIAAAQAQIGDYGSIPEKYCEAVSVCVAMGIITGVNNRGDFNGTGSVTRAQAAAILQRCYQGCFGKLTNNAKNYVDPVANWTPGNQTTTPVVATPTPSVTTPATPSTTTDTTEPTTDTPTTTATATGEYKTPNGTRWNKDSVNYPTTGLSSSVPNQNGFCTAASDVEIDSNAMLMYDMLDLINAERAKEGLKPYQWAPYDEFEEYALLRASESYWLLSHKNLDWVNQEWAANGNDWKKLNYHMRPVLSWGGLPENWAGGTSRRGSDYDTCTKVLSQWMNSPGHRRAIMWTDITYVVVAKCEGSWVLEFISDGAANVWTTNRCKDSGLTFIENGYTESPAAGVIQIHHTGE